MDLKDKSIGELIEILKDQAATFLDQCNPFETPTICRMLGVPENKELLVNAIVELNQKVCE